MTTSFVDARPVPGLATAHSPTPRFLRRAVTASNRPHPTATPDLDRGADGNVETGFAGDVAGAAQ
jgi:hypothetical protein